MPPQVEVVSSNERETVLRATIPGYFTAEVAAAGFPHVRFTLPGSPHLMVKGCPEVPFVVADVAIAAEGQVALEVIDRDSSVTKIPRYVPSKGHFPRTVHPSTVPYTFSEAYRKDSLYPRDPVAAADPFILRDVRGAAVAFYPFRYNPVRGEMTIAASITVRISTAGPGGKNVLTKARPTSGPREFLPVYRSRFVNYPGYPLRYSALDETGNMLIITNDSFYSAMQPLLYWKRQKGIPTRLIKLSAVGSTAADVKSYIQNAYDTDGVTFILLVGDADQMPYLTGTVGNVVGKASDPRYALLAGSDSYPDAFVSRFPAQTSAEASTMVNRVVNYEKTPAGEASWYHLGTGIASAEGSPADYTRMEWLRTDLLGYTYTAVDQIYDPGATDTEVTTALNAGRGIVNYIGHGSETAWVTTWFNVSDVYALNNTNVVPFILDVACVNGKFNRSGGDCFAEAWLKAGSAAAPKGAVGMYASSTNQDWVPPCDAQAESIDRLVDDSFHTFGGLCFNGVMKGLDNYPGTTGQQLYQQWHIFGDCSVMVFTDTPTQMTVTHDGTLPAGQSTYAVTVDGVENALCSLYGETTHILHGSAYTDGSGDATISVSPDPATDLTLTVTAFNRMPFFDSVAVDLPPAVADSISPRGDLQMPFGKVAVGNTRTEQVTVTNPNGAEDLVVTGVGFEAEASPEGAVPLRQGGFALENLPDLPATLGPAESVTFNVEFTPPDTVSYSEQLQITSDHGNVSLDLSGSGGSGVQHGVVSARHKWARVRFAEPFNTRPVVVAGPATCAGKDPGVARIRKVTKRAFEIRFQEWPYLNGRHKSETIAWAAVEQGVTHVGGGRKLAAGRLRTSCSNVRRPRWVRFPEAFANPPVVLAQVQTTNGSKAVADRICGVRKRKFSVAMQGQEASGSPPTESVGYIALSKGVSSIGSVSCATGVSKKRFAHRPADLSTGRGTCRIYVEEEQSRDKEIKHQVESVGYVAFGGAAPILVADMQTCAEADTATVRYNSTVAELCRLTIRAEDDSGRLVEGAAAAMPARQAYRRGAVVRLQAQQSVLDGTRVLAFDRWELDGVPMERDRATVEIEMTASRKAVAAYRTACPVQ